MYFRECQNSIVNCKTSLDDLLMKQLNFFFIGLDKYAYEFSMTLRLIYVKRSF